LRTRLVAEWLSISQVPVSAGAMANTVKSPLFNWGSARPTLRKPAMDLVT
jgi:hypothetical protein